MKPKLDYSIKRSRRARRISVSIHHTGEVIVTMPMRGSELVARAFVHYKSSWIRDMQEKMKKKFLNKIVLDQSAKDFKKNKKEALAFVTKKVEEFNRIYNFEIGEIRVRNQKSRWGSCASNGNLSFNYALMKVPEELADYVVVHEICHIKEFNHSKNFWNLVGKAIPDYKASRKALRQKYISIR